MGRGWTTTKLSLSGAMAILVLASVGCATIESVFAPPPAPKAPAPPPPPPVRLEPVAPAPVKKEPVPPPPAKKEPELPAPPKPEPETPPKAPAPPAKIPTPAPPVPAVKKEPVPPPPAKKEPEPSPPAKAEPETPTKKEPEAPPPVLAPQVGKQGEEHLRRTALSRMQRSEEIIGQLEAKKLTKEQQEQLLTVQSLLGNAREALSSQDLTKASNLAEKARILAEELAQTVR